MLKKGMLGAAFALLVAGAGAFAQKQQVMLDKVVAVVGGFVDPPLRSGGICAAADGPAPCTRDIPPTATR